MKRRQVVRWASLFCGVTLVGLFFSSQVYLFTARDPKPYTWRRAIAATLPDWYLWAVLAVLVVWLSKRYPFDRNVWRRSFLIHLPASLVVAALHIFVGVTIIPIFQPVTHSPWWWDSIKFNLILLFHWNVLVYWAIVSGHHALHYYRSYREKEVRTFQLESQLAQAQLQALKMQLHPHFLFNALNSISALLHKDPNVADKMIARLGDFLRITLANTGTQEVTLQRELEFINSYLEIERIRFQDRLQIQLRIDPEALDALVPNLLWQPVLENAIRYGIAPRSEPGRIEIEAKKIHGRLRLSIKDDGPGIPGDSFPTNRGAEGLGLANTRARLDQFYGNNHRFELHNMAQGGLEVVMEIPFKPETCADPLHSHHS